MLGVKYIILMIGDGQGANQIQAANHYTGQIPQHQAWPVHWVSTFEAGGSYDPQQAWSNFSYVLEEATDSAAAATAMYTGIKTVHGRISVSADGQNRLSAITEKAHQAGWSVGAVTSVYLSHATPGAWMAHNTWRSNGFAIADEGLWGDPNTTGTPDTATAYSGGHGSTLPPLEVIIGAGHPVWEGGTFVNMAMRDKLASENGLPGEFVFVERIAGSPDGGIRLLSAASNSTVTRLAGLFGGESGNLDYRLADGSGYDPENPTLAQMTGAALQVLSRDPDGFILLIEGGAIDWACHSNDMDHMLGEVIDFNQAVQTVIDWVETPGDGSDWNNTLVLVTGDHETGYLTAGQGQFPQQTLGEISPHTLALEKEVSDSGLRASWEDTNNDNLITSGEIIYWAWNTSGHTNSLVPLYARGAGAELLDGYWAGDDPVRGAYMDNTSLFSLMAEAMPGYYFYFPLIAK
jgi:alkaline phosphatase